MVSVALPDLYPLPRTRPPAWAVSKRGPFDSINTRFQKLGSSSYCSEHSAIMPPQRSLLTIQLDVPDGAESDSWRLTLPPDCNLCQKSLLSNKTQERGRARGRTALRRPHTVTPTQRNCAIFTRRWSGGLFISMLLFFYFWAKLSLICI